jgi:hypothetical protein
MIEHNRPNYRKPEDEIKNSNSSIEINSEFDNNTVAFDYLDVHLIPQTYEHYNAIYEQPHIPVRLIDLAYMNAFFDNCNATQPPQHQKAMYGVDIAENKDTNGTNNSTNNDNGHLRRNDAVSLTTLNKSIYDVDPTILERVCYLYQIDVDMILAFNQALQQKAVIQSLCLKKEKVIT